MHCSCDGCDCVMCCIRDGCDCVMCYMCDGCDCVMCTASVIDVMAEGLAVAA